MIQEVYSIPSKTKRTLQKMRVERIQEPEDVDGCEKPSSGRHTAIAKLKIVMRGYIGSTQ